MKRIKRIKGLTNQIKNLKHIQDTNEYKKEKDRIINRVLNEYTTSGFRLNDKPITLIELSEFIGISTIDIMRRINKLGAYLLENNEKGMYQVLLAQTLRAMLETRGLTMNQAQVLMRSQDAEYKPFISTTVNESLRALLSSDSNFLSLLKLIQPTLPHQPTQINIHQEQSLNKTTNLMNINDAVRLINDNRTLPLLEDPNSIERLGQTYIGSDVPEILATKQKGSANELPTKPKKKLKVHELRHEDDGEIINPEIK